MNSTIGATARRRTSAQKSICCITAKKRSNG